MQRQYPKICCNLKLLYRGFLHVPLFLSSPLYLSLLSHFQPCDWSMWISLVILIKFIGYSQITHWFVKIKSLSLQKEQRSTNRCTKFMVLCILVLAETHVLTGSQEYSQLTLLFSLVLARPMCTFMVTHVEKACLLWDISVALYSPLWYFSF